MELGIDSLQIREINDIVKLKAITKNSIGYHTIADYQALVARANDGITEKEGCAITRENFIKNLEGGQ